MILTRRKFIQRIGRGCAVIAAGGAVDAFAVEPNIVIVNRVALAIKELPSEFDGKTIAHISDLHLGDCAKKAFLLSAIEKLNALEPDIVVLTGDYTSKYDKKDYLDGLPEIFSAVKSRDGVFACMGNHDYGLSIASFRSILSLTTKALEQSGVVVLRNSHTKITCGRASIYMIGLGDEIRWDCKPKPAFESLEPSIRRIVIAHSPDCFNKLAGCEYDALLCGHTHGGQVCLPYWGPLYVPVDDKRFRKGLYRVDGKFIYVNSGLATLPARYPGPRFFCPPEITLYKLSILPSAV